jgi:hypothetical protein
VPATLLDVSSPVDSRWQASKSETAVCSAADDVTGPGANENEIGAGVEPKG